ncbi:MAG: FumA C-terminus/TtdB family hydratase beta subunit, partial [Candidatus Bathyarchaeia archaeon]
MAIYHLKTPISEGEIRKLKVNDVIYITGTIVTARDQAHRRALEYFKQGKPLPINLEGLAVFHCGPVVSKEGDKWVAVAAGPTTSTRMDIFEDEFIKNFKVRVVIGKGGMGKRTTDAMAKYGAVYGAFTGGAAILAAKAIKNVRGVEWLDLGTPEALWIFEVEDFGPLTVAIDSHGNNLFMDVAKTVEENRKRIY